jgi:hypothetical protein
MDTPSRVVGPEQSLLLWCWVRHVAAEPPGPLRAESEHVSGRVLAVQLQAIGPKRNSALLRPGFRIVAHAATWPSLPLRSATTSEQQSTSAPDRRLTWPPVRGSRSRGGHRPCHRAGCSCIGRGGVGEAPERCRVSSLAGGTSRPAHTSAPASSQGREVSVAPGMLVSSAEQVPGEADDAAGLRLRRLRGREFSFQAAAVAPPRGSNVGESRLCGGLADVRRADDPGHWRIRHPCGVKSATDCRSRMQTKAAVKLAPADLTKAQASE